METFFFWVLIALGPSVAALAWFAWYSEELEGSAQTEAEAGLWLES